jgi:hypothetical protein
VGNERVQVGVRATCEGGRVACFRASCSGYPYNGYGSGQTFCHPSKTRTPFAGIAGINRLIVQELKDKVMHRKRQAREKANQELDGPMS